MHNKASDQSFATYALRAHVARRDMSQQPQTKTAHGKPELPHQFKQSEILSQGASHPLCLICGLSREATTHELCNQVKVEPMYAPLYPKNPDNPLHQAQGEPKPQSWKASGNFTQAEADACNQAEAHHLRQVTIGEHGMLFALKNGNEILALSPIREPLVALAKAYNHAEALAEALRRVWHSDVKLPIALENLVIETLQAYEKEAR